MLKSMWDLSLFEWQNNMQNRINNVIAFINQIKSQLEGQIVCGVPAQIALVGHMAFLT